MKTLTMEQGTEIYGPLFKSHDYVTVLHAVATKSIRGDQAHLGAHLMSFHSTFCAMVEATLLAIAKAANKPLSGLPYWRNLDDPSQVLSDAYFVTHPGKGVDYQVDDGAFGNWTIPSNFDINDWSPYIRNMTDNAFVGNEFGYLRSMINPLASDVYVAYPYVNLDGDISDYPCYDWEIGKACLESPYDPKTFTIFNESVRV
jgi:hypothetical protein